MLFKLLAAFPSLPSPCPCCQTNGQTSPKGKRHLLQLKQLLLKCHMQYLGQTTLSQTCMSVLYYLLYFRIYFSIYLSICLSIYPSVYLSIYLHHLLKHYIMFLAQCAVKCVPCGPVSQRKHWPALQTPKCHSPNVEISSSSLSLLQAIELRHAWFLL